MIVELCDSELLNNSEGKILRAYRKLNDFQIIWIFLNQKNRAILWWF